MPINEIQKLIKADCKNRSFILGIDGLGGAGKTTYVQSVLDIFEKKGINAVVLHMDDFIQPEKIRYDSAKEEWYCYYYLQWRYDYFISEILTPIHLGKEIQKEIELYDKTTDTYKKHYIEISRDTVVIIEGIFLQRPELSPYFDYVIFIDLPKEERLNRVIKRDTYIGGNQAIQEKYEQRYFPAEEKYMTDCSPAKRANYIIRT
ncbi:uridine kinase [Bacillus sp. FJAT-29790]|uniref:uridine kinase n=1 Tax=Bacillus sp. FJAT-29790 TaxID=1895002 RepID=UPI001C241746|nr:uridine kinase [Bacillus sp. FJAT-29790]MBU8880422.1 uridine kinase [Bacillus sp. FJAT-29790]